MSNLLYLSHARVRETQLIPREELIAAFRELARGFPMPPRLGHEDELKERAREILKAMPAPPELWWHGRNKQACPCPGCCASAYVLMRAHIENYFVSKPSRQRRSAA